MDDKQLNKQTRDAEAKLLRELRLLRRGQRLHVPTAGDLELTPGQRIADIVAATMGSWRFIIIQSSILVIWIGLNVTGFILHWDPYPFILLNLALSFQAAYAAPFIMMSQNRQQEIDRQQAADDYRINVKAELEIELLHEKIESLHLKLDALREKEVLALTQAVANLSTGPDRTALRLELFVADLERSQRFYEQTLGFIPIAGQSDGSVALSNGRVRLSLNSRQSLPADHPIHVRPDEQVGCGVEIVLEVADIDTAFAKAQAMEPKKSSMLVTQKWGLRDFRVIDPDGYSVRVTEALV